MAAWKRQHLSWASVLSPIVCPQNSCPSGPANVTLSGNKVFAEATKFKAVLLD